MDIKPILRAASAMQAAAIMKNSAKLAAKKKIKAKDFVKIGTGTIMGSALLKEQAAFIEGM